MTAPKRKRCRHTSGWLTPEDVCAFIGSAGSVRFISGSRRRDQLLVKCNISECRAHRFAYFAEDGSFVKFGKVRYIEATK